MMFVSLYCGSEGGGGGGSPEPCHLVRLARLVRAQQAGLVFSTLTAMPLGAANLFLQQPL